MTPASIPFVKTVERYGIWLIGVSFVLFQFFLQLSSGVIIGSIMHEMHLSALMAGILGSSFYYVYTSLQIPVGLLFDSKNTRVLLTSSAALCGLGCFFFAHSYSLPFLILGRMIIGTGSAFAFVGLSHLLRQHFPLRQFGFMIGLSETLGFLATMFGMISIGAMVSQWGWRSFLNGATFVGLGIAFCSWQSIPDYAKTSSPVKFGEQIGQIFTSSLAWLNGLFVGLSFTVITVFGAMWAVPFIQIKLSCNLILASTIDSMIFLGAALSCPLFGYLAVLFKRRPLMLGSCLSTAILILIVLYLPFPNAFILGFFMLMIGLCCGAYMLAFSIANELAPSESLSTCTGFTNTLAMITAPLLQPLVGFLLDEFNQKTPLEAYQAALLVVPISLLIAASLALFLPEKNTV
ncbi:MFS transporter [Legionella hackeliae]|uniref:Major facilitator family transporter n=1 Tax=Legionella hackeliae TaxID=449 RepID=A0A0A8USW7_LEGHA|nr:MFS transporter [Legionella hackeliae]KTD10380.1 major facilitator family transporter [Legionella hackeliae]CEK09879.1 Major facilitator family transporter [Legionella hackeliae]STX49789.1 major facilitator family transporter [Legionella hackeliae]